MEQNNLKNLLMINNRTEGEQAILELIIAHQNLDYAPIIDAKDEKLKFVHVNMAMEAITIAEKRIDLIKLKTDINKSLAPISEIGKEEIHWTNRLKKYLPRFLSA